jgi:HAD superfamily hydrolase (TIGR01484 family)
MYAFFIDIDATMFTREGVSAPVREAIIRARNEGHKVFINTGRGFVGMPKEIYEMEFDGFVNSMGLEVCVGEKFIHRKFIPTERAIEIAKLTFDNNFELCLEGEVRIDINRNISRLVPDANNVATFEEVEKILKEKRVCKLVVDTCFSDEEKESLFPEFNFVGREVIYKGYDKAFGIKVVEEYLNIPHENTVAMGNDGTDSSMVTYAGIGIAVENSSSALKSVAKYMTKSCYEDGVAFAIDCILNGDISPLERTTDK